MQQPSIWQSLNSALSERNFSAQEISKITEDLLMPSKAEATTQLLEELNKTQQAELQSQLSNKTAADHAQVIQAFLGNIYSTDKLQNALLNSTATIIKEYLQHLMVTMNPSQKKHLLAHFA